MLEKLFTSKTRIKLLTHLLFSTEEYKLRELSRKLKIPVSAVSRELKNLQNISLVKKEKEHFTINSDSNILLELRNIFIKTDAFKIELEKSLESKLIQFAFVFGSFANETYTAESDIDLFIVGKISNEEVFLKIKPLERKLAREINPIIWPLADLKKKKNSSIVRDIARKKIIMLKGKEYELRKIIS
ncbi:MAG: nucleotidyltransferase domain-containing protein [Nanoarchaeota archaeon]|nr:nucleotidyltransferase domain-containing protein [Nanoarchaeota archaeon]MBU1632615.1 nucleotidyltransferase domain-containing protein [Nanoarchaeota archaeon]MBU1876450.1 nucleotidyltransferase domain-containing protein [Nanoarchaeota archaeon]